MRGKARSTGKRGLRRAPFSGDLVTNPAQLCTAMALCRQFQPVNAAHLHANNREIPATKRFVLPVFLRVIEGRTRWKPREIVTATVFRDCRPELVGQFVANM